MHIRTTNPIESTFATVRLRTKRTRGKRLPCRLPGDGLQVDEVCRNNVASTQRLDTVVRCHPRRSVHRRIQNRGRLIMIRSTGFDLISKEQPDYANSLNGPATLLQSTGRSKEAERFCCQAMEISRRVLGEQHPGFASIMHNLAGLLNCTRRSTEAEPLRRRAMEIRRKVLGEEHSEFAERVKNLENMNRTRKSIPNLESSRAGRNAPCPCGSGKKHKKCCGQGSAS